VSIPENGQLEEARIFADQKKNANPRRAKAIDHIWNAAMTLIEADKPVNAAAVGALAHKSGGPKPQSIRNNDDYRRLVRILAEIKPKRSSRRKINDKQLLDAVGNEADKSRIRQLISERDHLRDQLSWLKKAVREDLYEDDLRAGKEDNRQLESEVSSPVRINVEWAKLLDPDFWAQCDCELMKDGVYLAVTRILSREALDDLEAVMEYQK
jgi:hypothetical protein